MTSSCSTFFGANYEEEEDEEEDEDEEELFGTSSTIVSISGALM
jgi:hypothetical protein